MALAAAALMALAGCNQMSAQAQPAVTAADVAKGEQLFKEKCLACHTIGEGVRAAPDLLDIHKRRDRAWLKKWMNDPIGMAANDPIGKQLLAEWKGVQMQPANLTEGDFHQLMAYVDAESKKGPKAQKGAEVPKLTDAQFAQAKQLYFDRCAGCHGTLRAGATGPAIQEKRTRQIGTEGLKVILTQGTPGGMPAWGRDGILSQEEIGLMAAYVQLPPPEPPQLSLEKMKESWKLSVPVDQRPKQPQTKRNWQNFFGVILRDAGQVAVVDGDTKEKVAILNTGFAVHILRSSSSGRYFYAIGRDGKVTLIDLWTKEPTIVAQVQSCYDGRSVDASKYKGYEDKYTIVGCYWPPQYAVLDGRTLEPLKVVDVLTPTYDTNEPLKEVRVASIIASHFDPYWVVSLKESGHVALVDYSKPEFPVIAKIPAERFLHDGGWDKSKRYFMVAANMRNKMAVVDVKEKKLVTKFETGNKPHPGRGANWLDPQFGWVNGTTHIGEAKMVVYGADPQKKPEHAWKVVREVKLPGAGGLFIKTHDKSPWVWMDAPLSNDDAAKRQLCVYSKKLGKLEKCFTGAESGRAAHIEYNKAGTEVWVSVWDKKGQLVVYNDKDLKEVKRITGDWLVTPTGKFNVYNTAHDVY